MQNLEIGEAHDNEWYKVDYEIRGDVKIPVLVNAAVAFKLNAAFCKLVPCECAQCSPHCCIDPYKSNDVKGLFLRHYFLVSEWVGYAHKSVQSNNE